MPAPHDLRLDTFVCQVLKADRAAAGALLAAPSTAPPQELLTELLWPALDCAQRLHRARCISRGVYNGAIHTLDALATTLFRQLPAGPDLARSLFLTCAPGEPEPLGAKITADLAGLLGWRIHFAGAGLTAEEITYALGRLHPDVYLLHINTPAAMPALKQLIARLHRSRIWPAIQLVASGSAIEHPRITAQLLRADLAGRDPIEILEFLALCPEQRCAALVPEEPPAPLWPASLVSRFQFDN